MDRSVIRRKNGTVKRQALQGLCNPIRNVIVQIKRQALRGVENPIRNAIVQSKRGRELASATTSTGSCSIANTSRDGSLQPVLGSSNNNGLSLEDLPDLTINPKDITAIPEEPLDLKYKDLKVFVVHESSILFKNEVGEWMVELLP